VKTSNTIAVQNIRQGTAQTVITLSCVAPNGILGCNRQESNYGIFVIFRKWLFLFSRLKPCFRCDCATSECYRNGRQVAGVCFKADSHMACRAHAAPKPFPCHAVPLIHFAMRRPRPAPTVPCPSWKSAW